MSVWPFRNATRLSLTEPLTEKFGSWLRPEIVQMSIFHHSGKCFLEIVNRLPKPADPDETQHHVQTIDLSFIADFSVTSESIFDDAKLLVEDLGPYGIINTLPLFTDEASEIVSKIHLSLQSSKIG